MIAILHYNAYSLLFFNIIFKFQYIKKMNIATVCVLNRLQLVLVEISVTLSFVFMWQMLIC